MKTKPIINCHTHVFVGDYVPPYLAKTFVPWPLYYLLSLTFVIQLFRLWYKYPVAWQQKPRFIKTKQFLYKIRIFFVRNFIAGTLMFLIGLLITISVFFILYDGVSLIVKPSAYYQNTIIEVRDWLSARYLLFIPKSLALKLVLCLVLISFFKLGRSFVFFILKKIWSFLSILPGPDSRALAMRYLSIGRFAFYQHQQNVFERLQHQYPTGSGFVLLPMDMEFMEAGPLRKGFSYQKQMEELLEIKYNHSQTAFPFVFVDPRRLVADPNYFKFKVSRGKIEIQDCFIKEYIEDHKFSGFKIYPALGYYPFDEKLLPLWKYAADNCLPILTHCIRGTIFYRGKKKKEWDSHPVFEQVLREGELTPLMLTEVKNKDFANNFTHPLNYLCLLEERLLRKLVSKAEDNRIHTLFGFTNDDTPLAFDLKHLKLCFGHFGGNDEWQRFEELDRDDYSSQLIRKPTYGIDFLRNSKGKPSPGKLAQLWRNADWYTIICSLMLQYPNVYADLSYILYDPGIQPLLKQTLLNPSLQSKVLFGTDFYVVRNHKSDKSLLADMMDQLPEQEFDLIARANPRFFLQNCLPNSSNQVLIPE